MRQFVSEKKKKRCLLTFRQYAFVTCFILVQHICAAPVNREKCGSLYVNAFCVAVHSITINMEYFMKTEEKY